MNDKSHSSDVNREFEDQAAKYVTHHQQPINPVARPVSQIQIDMLHKTLRTPTLDTNLTPMGTASRQIKTQNDEAILAEIGEIRKRLYLRRDAAQQAFSRATGTPRRKRKRRIRR